LVPGHWKARRSDATSGSVAEGHGDDDDYDGDDDDEEPLRQCPEAADEFRAYSILYACVRNSWMDLKAELARSLTVPSQVPSPVRAGRLLHRHHQPPPHAHPPNGSTMHAVSVVKALDDHDYRTFFRLYSSAPHMSAYLMDFLVKRACHLILCACTIPSSSRFRTALTLLRVGFPVDVFSSPGVRDRAYERIVSAYRPNVGIEHVRECLHFDDLEETRQFLRRSGAAFVEEAATPATSQSKAGGASASSRRHRRRREGGEGGGTSGAGGSPPFWVDCKASAAKIVRTRDTNPSAEEDG
jgi:hypothetical protein